MNKPSNKKSYATIYLSSFYFSLYSCELEWFQVFINERGHHPIYTFQVNDLIHDWGQPLIVTGMTYPRETPKIHCMMLYWRLLPWLTINVVPQGPYTIMTSRKEENTFPMGLKQNAMIIYIKISSKVTNILTLPLNYEGILSLSLSPQSSTHMVQSSS